MWDAVKPRCRGRCREDLQSAHLSDHIVNGALPWERRRKMGGVACTTRRCVGESATGEASSLKQGPGTTVRSVPPHEAAAARKERRAARREATRKLKLFGFKFSDKNLILNIAQSTPPANQQADRQRHRATRIWNECGATDTPRPVIEEVAQC